MLDRLKDFSPRQRYALLILLFTLVLCVWVTTQYGLIAGLAVLGGISAPVSLWPQIAPARPRLSVVVRSEPDPVRLDLVPTWRLRPLDKEAIVQEQVNLALATLPEPPDPKLSPDDDFGQLLTKAALAGVKATLTGATPEFLEEFKSKVKTHSQKLVRWLEEVEKARVEHLKVFEGELRIHELGHASADHVHLRLRFPPGFKLAQDLPYSELPPDRPSFGGVIGLPHAALNSLHGLTDHNIPSIDLPGSDKARYSMEGNAPVIDYNLGRVNQHDYRDAPAFSLRVPGPGSYNVKWEASAAGLGKPATGELTIQFAEPKQGEPITTLEEVETEREWFEQL
jgi:hypothetical protein